MKFTATLVLGLLFFHSPHAIAQNPKQKVATDKMGNPGVRPPVKTTTNPTKGPEILFDHTMHNFGKVSESIKFASHKYPFTNTGNETLFVQQVHTSCGCTTPDWTRDSIPPGGKGFIEARYETTNRIGEFKKSITVYSNAVNAPIVHLDIEGEVMDLVEKQDLLKQLNDKVSLEFAYES